MEEEEFADEYFEELPDGYECLGCGHFQKDSGFGYTCNRCCGGTLEEVYY